MEPADLTDLVAANVAVHRAEGILATMLDVPISVARVDLELRAQLADSSLADAAHLVLADHARRVHVAAPRHTDDQVLAVLRQHLNR